MKLYEINSKIMRVLENVDPETGEITEEQMNELEYLQVERNIKIEGIACWIKQLKAEAEAIKAEKQMLAERQSIKERHAEKLKDFLLHSLNGEKFESTRAKVSYRKTTSVEVFDEHEIPEEFWRVKRELSKADISAAIKAGTQVPGAVLSEKMNIQVK